MYRISFMVIGSTLFSLAFSDNALPHEVMIADFCGWWWYITLLVGIRIWIEEVPVAILTVNFTDCTPLLSWTLIF